MALQFPFSQIVSWIRTIFCLNFFLNIIRQFLYMYFEMFQAVGGNLTQAVRAQSSGTPLAVHEITTVTTQAQATGQATVQRAATASGNLTAAQLTATQRIHQIPGTGCSLLVQLIFYFSFQFSINK